MTSLSYDMNSESIRNVSNFYRVTSQMSGEYLQNFQFYMKLLIVNLW